MTIEFSQSGLCAELEQSVSDLGYITPTPIQSEIIPLMLEGHDVIGQAQTGTGKTAAFMLPIIQTLEKDHRGIQALILAPTRELALQVAKAANEYGKSLNVRVLSVYGGQPYFQQIRSLRQGVDIVVGTPGRLLDLIQKEELDLSSVNTVVIDEADEMLSMGFIQDVEDILSTCPSERQTALFSATMPPQITSMARKYMTSPKFIAIKSKHLTVDSVDHRYCLVNKGEKLAVLTRLFEVEDITSALIFVRTRVGTSDLVNELMGRGFPAEALNGDLNQQTREQVLNRFRNNQITVLVATDMAARGLDITDISHVFNYDLPEDPELYVHRVGRTGRAGKSGIAISLLTKNELWRLRRIEGFTRQTITRIPIPTVDEIEAHREEQLLEQLTVWLKRGRCQKELQMINRLVENEHDPLMIAAAALKIARIEEKQRPLAKVSEVREARSKKSRPGDNGDTNRNGRNGSRDSVEKGMVRLSISAGKKHGIRPADIVGSIAYHADFPGNSIGAINILDRHTLVDVPQQYVEQVLAKAGKYRLRKNLVKLELT
ncbi:MAG: DEAD/DEAH box helicase [Dehalococcoidales bacterium]|nr:DEAD/DEAH box helicase [Dehalococcoidales bacterium]